MPSGRFKRFVWVLACRHDHDGVQNPLVDLDATEYDNMNALMPDKRRIASQEQKRGRIASWVMRVFNQHA
jgi:hypothetical protein